MHARTHVQVVTHVIRAAYTLSHGSDQLGPCFGASSAHLSRIFDRSSVWHTPSRWFFPCVFLVLFHSRDDWTTSTTKCAVSKVLCAQAAPLSLRARLWHRRAVDDEPRRSSRTSVRSRAQCRYHGMSYTFDTRVCVHACVHFRAVKSNGRIQHIRNYVLIAVN